MEKAKRSPWLKALNIILIIVAIIVVLLVIIYFAIRQFLGVDIIKVRRDLKALNKLPDESTYITSPYTSNDFENAKQKFTEAGLGKMVSDNGLYEYVESLDKDTTTYSDMSMVSDLTLTGNELASVLNKTFLTTVDKNTTGDMVVSLEIMQIVITDVAKSTVSSFNKTQANVEMIVKIDLTELVDSLNHFPLSIVVKYAPKIIYAKVNFTITNEQSLFLYAVEPVNLTLNKLTIQETSNMLNDLAFLSLGTGADICGSIGQSFAGLIFKDTTGDGIFSSIDFAGAKDFEFVEVDGVGCIRILKNS